MPKKKIDTKGKPATCEMCGITTTDFVLLLVNPDPVEHWTWCDNCFVKTVKEEQAND